MKKIFKILVFLILFFIPITIEAKEKEVLTLFYGDGCPHCASEKEFLKKMKEKYPDLIIRELEIWYDEDNQKLLEQVKKTLNSKSNYIPFTVIGTSSFTGFNSNIEMVIEDEIKNCLKKGCIDVVGKVMEKGAITLEEENKTKESLEKTSIKDIPLLGKIDVKDVSLPLISIAIGLVDGFNPCAMWILLFIISILIPLKNRKKLLTLGITFLITSALIYLLFMVLWLNVTVHISSIIWIRNIIAIIALILAFINIKSFINTLHQDDGCEVVNATKRKKIIDKIKRFTSEKKFWIAFLGMIGLGITVNFIELSCSAGLPLLYTQVLALNDLTTLEYILNMGLYILMYMIDDIIIFLIAVVTFKVTGISNKYSKYSHLIGGIIMFIIGLLLLLKPEWIMFNF